MVVKAKHNLGVVQNVEQIQLTKIKIYLTIITKVQRKTYKK